MRPPYETFTKPTCRGSIMLGTGCRSCEKCQWEASVLAQSATGGTAAPPPPEDPRDARIRALEAEREALRAEVARKDEVGRDVLAHLVAAHSLLSRSPKTAAPSNKMFDLMLADYAASIKRGRTALGPWRPTHQHANGTLAREVLRASFGYGREAVPCVILEHGNRGLYVVAGEKFDRDFRPLTPDEQDAYVEAAMGGRTKRGVGY